MIRLLSSSSANVLDLPAPVSPLATYLAKLDRRAQIAAEDREELLSLPATVSRIDAHQSITKEGQAAASSIFLIDGLVSRQMRVNDAPQIISLSFSGDAVDLQTLFFHRTDHALVAHVPSTIASVPHTAIIDLCRRRVDLAHMIWHDTLVDSAIFREWTKNIGHRRAHLRIAAFFLEVYARLEIIGEAQDGKFALPMTQHEIASALGLSLVHLNKSLRRLREAGSIRTVGRDVQILDMERLKEEVGFNDAYLHLREPPAFHFAAANAS